MENHEANYNDNESVSSAPEQTTIENMDDSKSNLNYSSCVNIEYLELKWPYSGIIRISLIVSLN